MHSVGTNFQADWVGKWKGKKQRSKRELRPFNWSMGRIKIAGQMIEVCSPTNINFCQVEQSDSHFGSFALHPNKMDESKQSDLVFRFTITSKFQPDILLPPPLQVPSKLHLAATSETSTLLCHPTTPNQVGPALFRPNSWIAESLSSLLITSDPQENPRMGKQLTSQNIPVNWSSIQFAPFHANSSLFTSLQCEKKFDTINLTLEAQRKRTDTTTNTMEDG